MQRHSIALLLGLTLAAPLSGNDDVQELRDSVNRPWTPSTPSASSPSKRRDDPPRRDSEGYDDNDHDIDGDLITIRRGQTRMSILRGLARYSHRGTAMWRLLRETCSEFIEDECPRSAAALAYYAIFSLPALLLLVVLLTGMFVDRADAARHTESFLQEFLGERVAEQLAALLAGVDPPARGWQSAVGIGMLIVGATGMLAELQVALNRAWQVAPDRAQGGVQAFLLKRLTSLLLIAGMAALLLASLVLSWSLALAGVWAEQASLARLSPPLLRALEHVLSLAVLSLLFAATFRFLPDVRVDWSDVLLGGAITALLFVLGKTLLGWYLAWSDPTTPFGAAGSLALMLVWIYYSAMIYLFGAELTQVYARSRGKEVAPEPGATRQPKRQRDQSGTKQHGTKHTDWQQARSGQN